MMRAPSFGGALFMLQCFKLEFIVLLHWRGSARGFPLGGKLSQKTPKVDFVTDEGNICCIQNIFHISISVPSSAPSGHLVNYGSIATGNRLFRFAARRTAPRGKVWGALQN